MQRSITFRDALAKAQFDEMESDPSVFVYGLDVPDHKKIFGSTAGLLEKFGPGRCFGTPLSEDAMTGMALGAAISGLRPVHVHIRSDFMLLGTNQIMNMLSNTHYLTGGKLSAPVTIRSVIGRGWGQGAQHSKSLHGMFAHIPGLKVVMPTTPQDAYSLLRAAIRDPDPVIFLEHRWLYDIEGPVDVDHVDSLGKAVVRREGKDITFLTTSWMAVEAIKAAELLKRQDIDVEIVDVRSIAPLDRETILKSARKTKNVAVLDYDWSFCGFAAELSAMVAEECFEVLERPVMRFGFEHVPCPTTRPLENQFFPSAPRIIRAVEKAFGRDGLDLSGEHFYSYENKFKGPF